MFTGIIEKTAKVSHLEKEGSNLRIRIHSSLASELKVDQSVAHNGVCLTVVDIKPEEYEVVAIDETLEKTNLGSWKVGTLVNLERCMQINGRLDGHIVQGHVDQKGKVKSIQDEGGSWKFTFQLEMPSRLIVEKGSICINGVSLTAFEVSDEVFSVAIIPYTYEHTSFHELKVGDEVNLEFDIIGKYVERMYGSRKSG